MQPPTERSEKLAQRHERRMRRFARQGWIWLVFMVLCAAMMVTAQFIESRVNLLVWAFGLAWSTLFYSATGYVRRKLAVQDAAGGKGRET